MTFHHDFGDVSRRLLLTFRGTRCSHVTCERSLVTLDVTQRSYVSCDVTQRALMTVMSPAFSHYCDVKRRSFESCDGQLALPSPLHVMSPRAFS